MLLTSTSIYRSLTPSSITGSSLLFKANKLKTVHHQQHRGFTTNQQNRRSPFSPSLKVSASADAGKDDLEEIDPMTGMPLASNIKAVLTSKTVKAGGITLAYREAVCNSESATPDKLPVLCLHGIGSSSYCYRNTIRLLGEAGHRAIAVDWPGHGESDLLTSGGGDYSVEAMLQVMQGFVKSVGLEGKPFSLIVHGYILGQYGLLFALQNPDTISKLVILNTPLGLKTKLRPELAAYKSPIPFMRPKPGSPFDAAIFNAGGSPYAMQGKDADVYAAPYLSSPEKSAVIEQIMANLDYPALLAEVDEGYRTWRVPSLVLFGTSDPFLDIKANTLEWLDSKRTNMRLAYGIEAKLGHMPQEDFAEAINPAISDFLAE